MTIAVSSSLDAASPDEAFASGERQLLGEYVVRHGIPDSWPQLARGFTRYARGAAIALDDLAALCLKLMSLSDQDVVRVLRTSRFAATSESDPCAVPQKYAA